MALNIPNVGQPGESLLKGLGVGSQLFSRMMAPKLKREEMEMLWAKHQDDLALRKAAAGRAAQAASDAHKLALMKLDPNFEINQMKNWVSAFGQGNKERLTPSAQESFMPSIASAFGQSSQIPNAPQGLNQSQIPQDLGAEESFMPQAPQGIGDGQFPALQQMILQSAGQQPQGVIPEINEGAISPYEAASQSGSGGGIDMDVIKNSPILRGMFKKKFGIDPAAPTAQTPEDKQAMALDLFMQKEKVKQATKTGSGETLTAPIKTKYQNVIGGVTSARPILKNLIEETKKGNIPGQMIGSLFKRDAQASYKGEISTLLDGVRNAYTIPNTDSGTAKAEDKVLRKPGESDANYAKRLENILDQMEAREKDARIKLSAGNITAGTVHLVGPNGEDYDVPESQVSTILAENPGVRRG